MDVKVRRGTDTKMISKEALPEAPSQMRKTPIRGGGVPLMEPKARKKGKEHSATAQNVAERDVNGRKRRYQNCSPASMGRGEEHRVHLQEEGARIHACDDNPCGTIGRPFVGGKHARNY